MEIPDYDLAIQYRKILERVDEFEFFNHERTNTKVKQAYEVMTIHAPMYPNEIPMWNNRKYSFKVAAAEAAWMLMGDQNADFIMKKAPKLWGPFIEKDSNGNGTKGLQRTAVFTTLTPSMLMPTKQFRKKR